MLLVVLCSKILLVLQRHISRNLFLYACCINELYMLTFLNDKTLSNISVLNSDVHLFFLWKPNSLTNM